MELYQIVPLCNAVVYTLGALCLKRSTNDGIGPWRTAFAINLVLFLVAAPFWFFGKDLESWRALLPAAAVGASFFVGQICGCIAIHKGDVSVVTPVLGTKPILVALIGVSLGWEALSWTVWGAAVLSAVAVFLLRGGTLVERRRLFASIAWGLGSAAAYSLTDLLTQRFGVALGFEKLMAGSFTFVMIASLALIPMFRSPFGDAPRRAIGWLGAGAAFMAMQATAMAFTISRFGHASEVNILYSSRGIWSVALVWLVGHWFSNTERALGGGEMLRRLAGSILLLAAIGAVVAD